MWSLPFLGASCAILGLGFLAHAFLDGERKLSFQLGATFVCWAFATVIAVVLS